MGKAMAGQNCSVGTCRDLGVAVLGEQTLCLEHFVARCYEQLGEVDPRGRAIPPGALQLAAQMAMVEECSTQALRVSLTTEKLSNLERGRLLDLLLWAGELYVLLRRPGVRYGQPDVWEGARIEERQAMAPES